MSHPDPILRTSRGGKKPRRLRRQNALEHYIRHTLHLTPDSVDHSIRSIVPGPEKTPAYRPDFLFSRPSHVVIVECDERQHRSHTADEELVRMISISQTLLPRTVVFLRFNPDKFYLNRVRQQVPIRTRYAQFGRSLLHFLQTPPTQSVCHYFFFTDRHPDERVVISDSLEELPDPYVPYRVYSHTIRNAEHLVCVLSEPEIEPSYIFPALSTPKVVFIRGMGLHKTEQHMTDKIKDAITHYTTIPHLDHSIILDFTAQDRVGWQLFSMPTIAVSMLEGFSGLAISSGDELQSSPGNR